MFASLRPDGYHIAQPMPMPVPTSPASAHAATRSPGAGRDRLVVFADPLSPIGTRLAAAALRAARGRGDLVVVAVCDVARGAPPPLAWRAASILAANALDGLFGGVGAAARPPALVGSLRSSAWRHGLPYLVPPGRDVNAPTFVARLREELRPTLALSLVSLQIFAPELLAHFDVSVNYHNALLPAYRGLRATAWSLYHGETRSGFSFHHITAGIDEGNVLLSDALEVPPTAGVTAVEEAKSRLAAHRFDELFDLMVARDAGTPQRGTPSYFGRRACRETVRVSDPTALTWHELQRRLRAFGTLVLDLGGTGWEVTRLEPSPGRGPTAFRTADGVAVTATRFLGLPRTLYRLERRMRGIVTHG